MTTERGSVGVEREGQLRRAISRRMLVFVILLAPFGVGLLLWLAGEALSAGACRRR